MSTFEEERLAKIKENREYLKELGLDDQELLLTKAGTPVKMKQKVKVEVKSPEERLSMRIRGKNPNGEETKSRLEMVELRKTEEKKIERLKKDISFKDTNQDFIASLR